MRTPEEINTQIDKLLHLYRACKQINHKPSQYWYLAKIEALLWVLGEDYARIKSCELEAE